MKRDNILLFHIGMPKTGTTALQSFFYENREILKTYGWCYPDLVGELEGRSTSVKNGASFFTNGNIFDTEVDNWTKVWKILKVYLKKYHVIVSNEALYGWNLSQLLECAKENYNNIKVIIYLRRQDRMIESRWNQHIKGSYCIYKSFEEYLDVFYSKTSFYEECELLNVKPLERYLTKNINKDSHYKDFFYYDKLEQIRNIIGKENLIVRVYEKNQFVGEYSNIASDFLDAIQISPDWNKFHSVKTKNERLYGNFLEIRRIMNSLLLNDKDTSSLYNNKIIELSRELVQLFKPTTKEEGYFCVEERKRFLQQFEEQNEKVAREYLNRKDGVLFYDNRMDFSSDKISITSFEEDMIRTFTMLDVNLWKKQQDFQKELEKIQMKNQILVEHLWVLQSNNREIIYFGAGQNCKQLLKNTSLQIQKIIDNDEKKENTTLNGIKIIFTKKISDWKKYFIVVTCTQTDEIEEQLQKLELRKGENYVLAKDFI